MAKMDAPETAEKKTCADNQAVTEIDRLLAEIVQMNKEDIPFSTQVVVIEVELKKWRERLTTQPI